jgi:hypothetical protein
MVDLVSLSRWRLDTVEEEITYLARYLCSASHVTILEVGHVS